MLRLGATREGDHHSRAQCLRSPLDPTPQRRKRTCKSPSANLGAGSWTRKLQNRASFKKWFQPCRRLWSLWLSPTRCLNRWWPCRRPLPPRHTMPLNERTRTVYVTIRSSAQTRPSWLRPFTILYWALLRWTFTKKTLKRCNKTLL